MYRLSSALCLSAILAAVLGAQDPLPHHYVTNTGVPLTSGGFGSQVRVIGDLDLDGFEDYAVAAPDFDFGSGPVGRVYVYSGRSSFLLRTFDGAQAAAGFGADIAGLGDVNGDGVVDVAVSSPAFDDLTIGGNCGRVACFSGATGLLLWSALGDQAGSTFGAAIGVIGAGSPLISSAIVVGQPGHSAPGFSGNGRVVYLSPTNGQVMDFENGPVNFDGMGKTLLARAGVATLHAGSSGGRVYALNGPGFALVSPTLLIPALPGSNDAPQLAYVLGTTPSSSGLVIGRRLADTNGLSNNGVVSFLAISALAPLTLAEGTFTNAQLGIRLSHVRDLDGDGDEEIGFATGPAAGISDLRFSVMTTSGTLLASYLSTGAAPARFASLTDVTGDGRGEILQATASGIAQRFDCRMLSQGLAPAGMNVLVTGGLHYLHDIDLGAAHAGAIYLQLYSATNYAPGFVYQPGAPIVPIFPDALTDLVISLTGGVLYPDAVGYLDGAGRAQTNAFVEAVVATMFSGATFWTAACVIDIPNDTITAATNPVAVTLP